jgi:hypothetical protein
MSLKSLEESARNIDRKVQHGKAITEAPQNTAIDRMPTQPEPAPQPQVAQSAQPEQPPPAPQQSAPAPSQPKAPQQPSKVTEVRLETQLQSPERSAPKTMAPEISKSPTQNRSVGASPPVTLENASAPRPRAQRNVQSISSLSPSNRQKIPSVDAHRPSIGQMLTKDQGMDLLRS